MPVHVPSPESRFSAAVGAIKREEEIVGSLSNTFEDVIFQLSRVIYSYENMGHDTQCAFHAAPHQNKEWKTKSNQKPSAIILRGIRTPTNSNLSSADNVKFYNKGIKIPIIMYYPK
ncbi:hypothetical protein K2173_009639 [Erythroxylum novogranatense]|uniref:Uncharacterized protein n=1 Tax=Erythroxylum novogranatense TaxID=1862640 RepID=A0AAV8U4Q2_9ROSI|nr:hypothetical protein K2173_009639 [Erythroxylum novogranatense]